MQVFGNMHTQKITIAAGNGAEQNISNIVGTEKLIMLMPDAAGIHVLLTPKSSTHAADADDFLLPTTGKEFLIGRGLDRIALWNTTKATVNVYLAILY